MVLSVLDAFQVTHTISSQIKSITSKQTPCRPIPVDLKDVFQQEIDKMFIVEFWSQYKMPPHGSNSFVLVERKDKLCNLKLRICLDPTNLNKVIVREPYHFQTPEDFAHLLADACIMSVCNLQEGYWHQELNEVSSFLTTFNTELGRFRCTVMPFGETVAGDVFQHKLDQCYVKIKQVIVIADDIMIVGKKSNHSNHDQAWKTLLETARKCNVQWN